MSIDPTKLAALLALSNAGTTIACCEYLEVRWDDVTTNYYGTARFRDMPPFGAIPHAIEARIIPNKRTDPFHELELNPDLRTENITITFDDIDKVMTGLFQTYSSGVSAVVHLYYPDVDLDVEIWWGQLQAPQVYGWKTLKTTISNGYRSRELLIPGRSMRKECTAQVFGGKFTDPDAVRSSLCPYDINAGGAVGVPGFTDCPKTIEACTARFGTARYFGGFLTDASAQSSPNHGHPFLALSNSNASNFKDPMRVIFGSKYVRENLVLQWRPDTPPGYEHGFVRAICAVGEGPVQDIYNIRMNGQYISGPGSQYVNVRRGTRGQAATTYSNTSNFSGTALVLGVHGWVDTATIGSSSDITMECQVQGFAEVGIYGDDGLIINYAWSDDRVWCLLELYKNQKFGMGYAESEFSLVHWWQASDWLATVVTFVATYPDGETLTLSSQRSRFNAIVDGRPVAEVVEDICRSGAISVPFQNDGQFTLSTFRKATALELSNARVFYDSGDTPNIIREPGQPPMIELSQTPDNKVVNEVELRFEEAANGDIERSITVDAPDQKLKAGRQLGPDYFLSVPKKYTGFGINSFQEAVRMAYRLLKFGQFDEGGIDNNLQLKITVPFEQVLGIRRYEIIKVVSDLLDDFMLPSGTPLDISRYPVEYFRVLHMKKVSGGRCEITAQVYNHTSYGNFETDADGGGGAGNDACQVYTAGTQATRGTYTKHNIVNGKPSYTKGNYVIEWDGSQWILRDATTTYYTGAGGSYPWEAVWSVSAGTSPAPDIVEGFPPMRQAGVTTLGSPSYSSSTQLITIPC